LNHARISSIDVTLQQDVIVFSHEMKTVSRNYISMCAGIIEFYNSHKTTINSTEEMALHFTELSTMQIKLKNEYEKAFRQLMPIYKEKEAEKNELKSMLIKFGHAINLYLKKGKKKTDILIPPVHDWSNTSILRQYGNIVNKAQNVYKDLLPFGIHKEDFHNLEILMTKFVLALPTYNFVEEKLDEDNEIEMEIMQEIEFLLSKYIDSDMLLTKKSTPELYDMYSGIRKSYWNTVLKVTKKSNHYALSQI